MKQFYAPYTDWEDFKNGMYEITFEGYFDELVYNAESMLKDCDLFRNTCLLILKNWPVASKVNLTNKNCNRQAWLGQAACNYHFGVIETLTRIAWKNITEEQRIGANKIADQIIRYFELTYEKTDIEIY